MRLRSWLYFRQDFTLVLEFLDSPGVAECCCMWCEKIQGSNFKKFDETFALISPNDHQTDHPRKTTDKPNTWGTYGYLVRTEIPKQRSLIYLSRWSAGHPVSLYSEETRNRLHLCGRINQPRGSDSGLWDRAASLSSALPHFPWPGVYKAIDCH